MQSMQDSMCSEPTLQESFNVPPGYGKPLHRRFKCRRGTITIVALIVLLIGVLVGWIVGMARNTPATQELAVAATLPALGQSHSAFGLQLLQTMTQSGTSNVFISPLSIALGMAMCSRGANPEASGEIYQALQLAKFGDEGTVSNMYRNLLQHLKNVDATVALSLANSAWLSADTLPEYTTALGKYYSAEVHRLTTADPINAWVKEKTQGLIPTILSQLDPSTAFVLINAVYFKGAWQQPFNPKLTKKEPFQTPQGPKEVDMMHRSADGFRYRETKEYQMVELLYGKGTDYSAVIILPTEGFSCHKVVKGLTPATFTSLGKMGGDLALPRIKLGETRQLNSVLQALGIRRIFKGGLDRLSTDPTVAVDSVLHRAVVELNEEGTEAAAVTAIIATRSAIISQRFSMVVNRPFIFAIRLLSTGDLLFLGQVNDPQPD